MKPFDIKRWEVLKGTFDYFDFSQVPTDFPNPNILVICTPPFSVLFSR